MRLGILHVDRDIWNGLTAKEYLGWLAYAELEPFGELRADYRAASIAAMIANVNRGEKQKPFTLEDVMVKFGEPAEEKKKELTSKEVQEHQLRVLKLWAAAANQDVAIDKEPRK